MRAFFWSPRITGTLKLDLFSVQVQPVVMRAGVIYHVTDVVRGQGAKFIREPTVQPVDEREH